MDVPLDFDSLKKLGAIIGSGGLVVMDEDTCMVEVARFFMAFTQNESCGKCVPCREGTKRMLEILERIVKNEGTLEDLDLLEELSAAQLVVDEKRELFAEALKQRKILSNLRDKQYAQYKKDALVAEDNAVDDMVTARHGHVSVM